MDNNLLEKKESFDIFFKTDRFGEALGIVWGFGSINKDYFSVRHIKRPIVDRFAELVENTSHVHSHYRKEKDHSYWECHVSLQHPFFIKMKELGWAPMNVMERVYPKGDFDQAAFVKSYTRLHYDLGKIREKKPQGYYVRPRLRIHGSNDILLKINSYLYHELGIGIKKIQTDHKIERAKVIYFYSKKEIPKILEFMSSSEATEIYNSLKLGYQGE